LLFYNFSNILKIILPFKLPKTQQKPLKNPAKTPKNPSKTPKNPPKTQKPNFRFLKIWVFANPVGNFEKSKNQGNLSIACSTIMIAFGSIKS